MTDDIKEKVPETVARLRSVHDAATKTRIDAADLLEALSAQLAEVEAERDAARTALLNAGIALHVAKRDADDQQQRIAAIAKGNRDLTVQATASLDRAEAAEAEAARLAAELAEARTVKGAARVLLDVRFPQSRVAVGAYLGGRGTTAYDFSTAVQSALRRLVAGDKL